MSERSKIRRLAGTEALLVTPQGGGAELLRVQICPIGVKLQHPDGELDFSRDVVDRLVANFARYGDDVPVDYDHGTDDPSAHEGSGKAAGWIRRPKALRVEDDKLVAYAEPTPAAAAAVHNKEWRYTSPTIAFDWVSPSGESFGPTLLAVALTNRPYIRGMMPVELIDRSTVALRAPTGDSMKEEKKDGAAPQAPAETVSLADHNVVKTKLADVETKLSAVTGERDSLKDLLKGEQARSRALSDALAAEKKKLADIEAANMEAAAKAKVDAVIAAGLAPEAKRAALMKICTGNPEAFAELYPLPSGGAPAAQQVVPMSAVGVEATKAPPAAKKEKQSTIIMRLADTVQAEAAKAGNKITRAAAISRARAAYHQNPKAFQAEV